MDIDKILETFDLTLNQVQGKETKKIGLTIHFSVTRKMWVAGYGSQCSVHRVYGKTAEDALAQLDSKLNSK